MARQPEKEPFATAQDLTKAMWQFVGTIDGLPWYWRSSSVGTRVHGGELCFINRDGLPVVCAIADDNDLRIELVELLCKFFSDKLLIERPDNPNPLDHGDH